MTRIKSNEQTRVTRVKTWQEGFVGRIGRERGERGAKERKKRASTSSFFLPKQLKPWEDGSQGTDWYSRAIKCRMACQATDRSPGLIERIFHSDEFLSSLSDEFLAGVEAKIPLPPFSTSKGMVPPFSLFASLRDGWPGPRPGGERKKRTRDRICDFSLLVFHKKKKKEKKNPLKFILVTLTTESNIRTI